MNLTTAVIALQQGAAEVKIRPRGNSMTPLVRDGQLVIVKAMDHYPQVGEIVLVTVSGRVYLHKVLATDKDRVQIGNNHGRVNGWTHVERVWGYAALISAKPARDVQIRDGKHHTN